MVYSGTTIVHGQITWESGTGTPTEVWSRISDLHGPQTFQSSSTLTVNASAGARTVTIANSAPFRPKDFISIANNTGVMEHNQILSIAGNVLTLVHALQNSYTLALAAAVSVTFTQYRTSLFEIITWEVPAAGVCNIMMKYKLNARFRV